MAAVFIRVPSWDSGFPDQLLTPHQQTNPPQRVHLHPTPPTPLQDSALLLWPGAMEVFEAPKWGLRGSVIVCYNVC